MAAAATSAEPKRVSETAEGREIMADFVAEMKLAVEKNDVTKTGELLAQIRRQTADPTNPAQYPERNIKGFIIYALKNGKNEIARTLFEDMPVEMQEKYWQPLPKNMDELWCAVSDLKLWQKMMNNPGDAAWWPIETEDLIWMRELAKRKLLYFSESFARVVQKIRQQNKGHEQLKTLLEVARGKDAQTEEAAVVIVVQLFNDIRWKRDETAGPAYCTILRWLENKPLQQTDKEQLAHRNAIYGFVSFGEHAPQLFVNLVVLLMSRQIDVEFRWKSWQYMAELLEIVEKMPDNLLVQVKTNHGEVFDTFKELLRRAQLRTRHGGVFNTFKEQPRRAQFRTSHGGVFDTFKSS